MKDKYKICQCIHYNMSVCGGFFGAYAVLNFNDILGNAQTSNLIHLALDIVGRDLKGIMIRIVAVILYICGTMLTVLIPRYTKWNVRVVSVFIDMVAVLVLPCLSHSSHHIISLYPIFFAMSFQWNVFASICGHNSSTIFSTNNIRQMAISFTKYVIDRKKEDAIRGRFYAGTLLFYHIGVVISYLAWKNIGINGVYVCMFPLVTALALIGYEAGWIDGKQSAVIEK